MPQGLTIQQLVDLTKTTLQNLPKMEFEVALNQVSYPVCNHWFRSDRKKISSGTEIRRNIVLETSGNARMVRPYQKTSVNVADIQHEITSPWAHSETYWSIERREDIINSSPAAFVDLVKSRRVDAMLDLAYLMEEQAWSTPVNSTDNLNARGLPYWLSMRDAGSTGAGFDGKVIRYRNGTTSTIKAGIDGNESRNANWRNYAATYSAINNEFVNQMRRAFHATNFQPPMTVNDIQNGYASNFRIYMGLDSLTAYENLATQANDNIGPDLDPFHGITTFKRVPIIHVPQLDNADYDPIYATNHSKFFPFVLSGDWLTESEPMTSREQHNVLTTFVDSTFNFFCQNVRQGGFVIHKPIPSI